MGIIRKENDHDIQEIRKILKLAFYREGKGDFNEWNLVDELRNEPGFIKDLSRVYVRDNCVLGHILITPLDIKEDDAVYKSLALAPMAVHPDFQNQGIGHALIEDAIVKSRELGYQSIVVLGHPHFYKKFGFELASKYNIGLDESRTCDYLFALALQPKALDKVSGIIKYMDPFYNEAGELI